MDSASSEMLRKNASLSRRARLGCTWACNSWIRKFGRLERHETQTRGYIETTTVFETETIVVDNDDVRAGITPCEPAQTPILYRLINNTKA